MMNNSMHTEMASFNRNIGRDMLDRIAHLLSRMIGVPFVVEHYLGDYGTALPKAVD